MKIIKHGFVSPEGEKFKQYNAWPTVISLSDGTLLAAWSGERLKHICPFGKVLAARSEDGGYTWGEPYVIQNTPLDDRDAGLCPTPDGAILMTSFSETLDDTVRFLDHWLHGPRSTEQREMMMAQYDKMTDADKKRYHGSTLGVSRDNGYTFSDPVTVPVSSPHGPTVLSNGEILYVGSYAWKDVSYSQGAKRGICAIRVDTDCNILGDVQLIAAKPADLGEPAAFCEPYAKEMPNGDILVAIRLETKSHCNCDTFLCRSTDGGKSFSPATPAGWGGYPPHLFVTSKGEVVATYGIREFPMGIRARVSRDNGYTWGEEIVLRDDGLDWDLGYPSTTENEKGELVTTYYMKDRHDLNMNRIQYTIWTLE